MSMRYKQGQKEETRHKILKAIHKGFREHGFDGAGVDGLAKEAGVTSGAFYTHFDSKAKAFQEAMAMGVGEFRGAVEHYQQEFGGDWLNEFSDFYVGEKRKCELGNSCALQSLSSEVGRANEQTRAVYQSELLKAADSFASGLPFDEEASMDKTWATIAMLIGGATLARAVKDPKLADDISHAVTEAIKKSSSIT